MVVMQGSNHVLTRWYHDSYTGHEHLPWFNLINMNGRVYDPLIGQFLSPDNEIQYPFSTQNYNRYGYCLNNPLKYTDPSGYCYMQLLDMAYEGNPIRGSSCGGGSQVPYPEDYEGIEGGVNSAWSEPGSNYQKWSSDLALQNEYSSSEVFNAAQGEFSSIEVIIAAQGYYVYVNRPGEVTNEKTIVVTNVGSFEITLPTINVVTEKIWISTSIGVNQSTGGNSQNGNSGGLTQSDNDALTAISAVLTGVGAIPSGVAKPFIKGVLAVPASGVAIAGLIGNYNLARSPNWGDRYHYGIMAFFTAVSFTEVGAPISLGYSVADSYGAFDGVYEKANFLQQTGFWPMTTPTGGIIPIHIFDINKK